MRFDEIFRKSMPKKCLLAKNQHEIIVFLDILAWQCFSQFPFGNSSLLLVSTRFTQWRHQLQTHFPPALLLANIQSFNQSFIQSIKQSTNTYLSLVFSYALTSRKVIWLTRTWFGEHVFGHRPVFRIQRVAFWESYGSLI